MNEFIGGTMEYMSVQLLRHAVYDLERKPDTKVPRPFSLIKSDVW